MKNTRLANTSSQHGGAIIVLFIMVALFAAISYVFLQGTGGSVGWIKSEQSKAASTGTQDCTNAIAMAQRRLEMRGCGANVSLMPDGSNFTSGAPNDGSCSVFSANGGGIKPCGAYTDDCMKTLTVGQTCAGVIYAGDVAGHRVYAAMTDGPTITWNNGSTNWVTTGGAGSMTDGMTNTNNLVSNTGVGAPYKAAQFCRAFGAKWYLPAESEVQLLYTVRFTGSFNGTFDTTSGGYYWSSREVFSDNARSLRFNPYSWGNTLKNQSGRKLRCVRSD